MLINKRAYLISFMFHIYHLKAILFITTAFLWLLFAFVTHAAAITSDIWLNIGQSNINFWVFEFVVLVEAALATIRFCTYFHTTFIISFDLICITPHAFALLVIFITLAKLFILWIEQFLLNICLVYWRDDFFPQWAL